MKKWEYKIVIDSETLNMESRLNKMGQEGWELCGVKVWEFGSVHNLFFKRRVKGNDLQQMTKVKLRDLIPEIKTGAKFKFKKAK